MKTAFHVFRKDVRRLRFWLVLWLALVAAPLVLRAIPEMGFPFMFSRAMLATGVSLATVILFAVVITLVVHEDPATGSSAFWLTRPISPTSLWAAKLLFVFLVLVAPAAAVETIQLALTGIGAKLVALAIPEIVLEWSVWATAFLVLASITSSLAGMIPALLGGEALRGIAFLLVVVGTTMISRHILPDFHMMWIMTALRIVGQGFPDLATLRPGVGASQTLVRWTLGIACALAIARVQYGARRRGSSWGLIGATFILLGIVRVHWTWDLVGGTSPAIFEHAGLVRDETIHVTLDRHGSRDAGVVQRMKEGSPAAGTVRGLVSIAGVEPPNGGELRRLDGTLTFPDGHTLSLVAAGQGFGESIGWDPRAVQSLLGATRLVNLAQEEATTVAMTITSPSSGDLEKYAHSSGRLTATATVTMRAYRLAAELPLQPGATYRTGQGQAVMDALQCQNGDCAAMIRETHVSLLLAPSADHVVQRMLFFRVNPDVLYILRNRGRGEAFWPQRGTTFGFGWITRSRRDETTMVAQFRSSVAPSPPLPRLDGDWIAGADLVRIEATPVRDVVTQVEVPDFVIDGGSESSGAAAGMWEKSEALAFDVGRRSVLRAPHEID